MSGKIIAPGPPPNSAMDPFERLQIALNPDGTLSRLEIPKTPTTPTLESDHHSTYSNPVVLSKDIQLNQSNGTWARMYLPHQVLDNSSPISPTKLPLIVHYHGGGFIILNANATYFHNICSNIATSLNVIIVSVEYRLAPEHRLPAAYDDAIDALHCIKTTNDDWILKYADMSNCFLMGDSAGANIAYRAGLHEAECGDNLGPLIIKGLVLHQPYFGGKQRTESELRLENNPVLPLCVNDLVWSLALPVGVDRDHEYCNPTVDCGSHDVLKKMGFLGWRVLVTACDGDPLYDRQIEFVKIMEAKGVKVVSHLDKGGQHGSEWLDSLHEVLKSFIFSS